MTSKRYPEHDELTFLIIRAAMRVRTVKGVGLLEHAYDTFFCHELRRRGFEIESQQALPASYEGVTVEAAYRPDIIVNKTIIVEVKAVAALQSVHRAQLVTYLTEAGLKTGLLINFNAIPFTDGIRRISI